MATHSTGNNGGDVQRIDCKSLSWPFTALFLVAETTSLGVLGLPQAIKDVGLVPGLILIDTLYPLLWYTGIVVFQFKMRNLHIHSFADGLEIIFGSFGRWFGGVMQILYLLFVMAAHIVGFSLMMSTVRDHGTCKIEYKIVAMALYLVMTIRRTLKSNDFWYVISCLSIFAAAIVAMTGVAIHPAKHFHYHAVTPSNLTSLAKGAESVSTIIVASMAQIAYPTIISEMKEPRDFPKALALQQIVTLVLANVVAIVFYLDVGQNVMSPALSSAPGTIGKVAYGLAIPSIIVAGVIAALIAAKGLHSQIWRLWAKEEVSEEKSFRARASWLMVIIVLNGLALMLAWGIPIFEHLFSLMGSLFGTAFALTFPSISWFRMNWTANGSTEPLPVIVGERSGDLEVCEESTQKELSTRCDETPADRGIGIKKTFEGSTARSDPDDLPKRRANSARAFSQGLFATVRERPCLAVLNMIILVVGIAQCGLGTYGSIVGIISSRTDQTSLSC